MPPWKTARETERTAETEDDELPSFLNEEDPDRERVEILTDGAGEETD